MKLEFSRHVFEKYSHIKFKENPSIWVPSFSMRTERRTDTTELIDAFRNFAKVSKNHWKLEYFKPQKPSGYYTGRYLEVQHYETQHFAHTVGCLNTCCVWMQH
jgi:hypothetical protein